MVGVVPSMVGVVPSMVGVVPSMVGVVPCMMGGAEDALRGTRVTEQNQGLGFGAENLYA